MSKRDSERKQKQNKKRSNAKLNSGLSKKMPVQIKMRKNISKIDDFYVILAYKRVPLIRGEI